LIKNEGCFFSLEGKFIMKRKDFDRNKFLSETWPEALESQEFKQGKFELLDDEGNYCCLGVACELLSRLRLLSRKEWQNANSLPDKAIALLNITDLGTFNSTKRQVVTLSEFNDRGKSFNQIAKSIRSAFKRNAFLLPDNE
jgi:hypothetical protein